MSLPSQIQGLSINKHFFALDTPWLLGFNKTINWTWNPNLRDKTALPPSFKRRTWTSPSAIFLSVSFSATQEGDILHSTARCNLLRVIRKHLRMYSWIHLILWKSVNAFTRLRHWMFCVFFKSRCLKGLQSPATNNNFHAVGKLRK